MGSSDKSERLPVSRDKFPLEAGQVVPIYREAIRPIKYKLKTDKTSMYFYNQNFTNKHD
jgi:hypothetical protein